MNKNIFTSHETDDVTSFISKYYNDILFFCYNRTHNQEDAKDATQETFLKYFKYYSNSENKTKHRALLYKIAINVCNDFHEKAILSILDKDGYCDDLLAYVDASVDFDILTSSLTQEARYIIELKYCHRLTLKQISQILNIPMRTIQSRIKAAHKIIKQSIKD